MTDSLQQVTSAIGAIQQQQNKQADVLSQVTNTLGKLAEPAEEEESSAVDYNVDLESMSNTELANKMLEVIEDRVGQFSKSIEQKIDQFDSKVGTVSAQSQVNETRGKYQDFDHYKDEMVQLARENPGLSVERLYRLAKAENPQKVEEVDKKLAAENPPPEKDEGEDKPKRFGGMIPTGGFIPVSENTRMKPKDAADKAWEDVIAPFDDLEKSLSSSESPSG